MRYFLALFLLLVGSLSWSQERADSLIIRQGEVPDSLLDLITPLGTDEGGFSPLSPHADPGLIGEGTMINGPYTDQPVPQVVLPRFDIFKRGDYLPMWSTGYLYGANAQSGSLLYGYNAMAAVGLYQQLGDNFTFDGNLTLNKYSVYYNTATLNGSLTWSPNRHFSATAFGSYMPGTFLSSIQVGQAFTWGGYVTLQTDTDVPFGIDLGAYDAYSTYGGHEVVPIVQPFVKLGGAKLGFDFGPIIKNAIDRKNGVSFGPGSNPIPQPIKAMPSVAPRR